MDCEKTVRLNNGFYMPIVGLGMFQSKEEHDIDTVINTAIDAGYRHIDTAFAYSNEHLIGNVLQKMFKAGKIKREDLFIVSKLPPNGMQPDAVEHFFQTSLKDLQLKYIDLYLIHCPTSSKRQKDDKDFFPVKNGVFDADNTVDLVKTWQEMEKLVRKGLVKAIGLSNFNSRQIQRIYDAATIKPSVLQVECHAYLPQYELQEFCNGLKIAITAYSPLGAPYRAQFKNRDQNEISLIDDPQLKPLCDKYKKTSAQILLRYLIQRKIIVIPKSTNPNRIKENIDVFNFKIEEEDIEILKSMSCNKRFFSLMHLKGLDDHPEFPYNIPF